MPKEPPKRDLCEQMETQVWGLRIGTGTRESKNLEVQQTVVIESRRVKDSTQRQDAEIRGGEKVTETDMFREDGGGAEMSRPPGSECRAGVTAAKGPFTGVC